jgi:hypothetical protein
MVMVEWMNDADEKEVEKDEMGEEDPDAKKFGPTHVEDAV